MHFRNFFRCHCISNTVCFNIFWGAFGVQTLFDPEKLPFMTISITCTGMSHAAKGHKYCSFCDGRCDKVKYRTMSQGDIAAALTICSADRRQHFLDLQQRKAENPSTLLYIHVIGCYVDLMRLRAAPPPPDPMTVSSSEAPPAATPPVTRSDLRSAKEEALATNEGALQNQTSTVLL
jgi:hypothetical protein